MDTIEIYSLATSNKLMKLKGNNSPIHPFLFFFFLPSLLPVLSQNFQIYFLFFLFIFIKFIELLQYPSFNLFLHLSIQGFLAFSYPFNSKHYISFALGQV
jgi:hypothetical protein